MFIEILQKDEKSNFITEYATIFKRNFWFYFGKIPGLDTLGVSHSWYQKGEISDFLTVCGNIFERNFWFYFGKIPGLDTLGPDMGMEIK